VHFPKISHCRNYNIYINCRSAKNFRRNHSGGYTFIHLHGITVTPISANDKKSLCRASNQEKVKILKRPFFTSKQSEEMPLPLEDMVESGRNRF
jgi:hypothetical protein